MMYCRIPRTLAAAGHTAGAPEARRDGPAGRGVLVRPAVDPPSRVCLPVWIFLNASPAVPYLGVYVLSGALKWPFWDKMSHFVQTFVWRNGWVSGLLWGIDGFVMKFLAMPLRSERRYLPSLGVQNGNLPQNGCGETIRLFRETRVREARRCDAHGWEILSVATWRV